MIGIRGTGVATSGYLTSLLNFEYPVKYQIVLRGCFLYFFYSHAIGILGSNSISEFADTIPGGKEQGDGEGRRVRGEGAREGGGEAGEEGGRAPPGCRGRARGGRRAAERERSMLGQAEDDSYS